MEIERFARACQYHIAAELGVTAGPRAGDSQTTAAVAPAVPTVARHDQQPRPQRFAWVTSNQWRGWKQDKLHNCCVRRCVQSFDSNEWRANITRTHTMRGETELKAFVAQITGQLQKTAGGFFRYTIKGQRVCVDAFMAWYGIEPSKFKGIRKMAKRGSTIAVHGNSGGGTAPLYSWTVAAYGQIVREECDTQVNGTVYFTRHFGVDDILRRILEAWIEDGFNPDNAPSEATVRRAAKDPLFAHVKMPLKGQWGICTVCLWLHDRRVTAFTLEWEKQQYLRDAREHRRQHRATRLGFDRRRFMSIREPSVFHMYIVDLTRSQYLPHDHPMPKAIWNKPKLQASLGGVMGFHSNRRVLFSWLPRYSKGANLIATILLWMILADKTSRTQMAHARILFLQIDGGSENANRFIVALCALLVELGVYDVVFVNRMIVGHTHSQIDQFFRPLRAMLNRSRTFDGAGLVQAMRASFLNDKPTIVLVEEMLDFAAWIESELVSFEGIKKALGLRFRKDSDNRVSFTYKSVPELETHWRGSHGIPEGEPGFRPLLAYRNRPAGQPAVLLPPYVPDKDVLATIDTCHKGLVPRDSQIWLDEATKTSSWGVSMIGQWQPGSIGQPGVIRVGDNVQPVQVLLDLPRNVWRLMQEGGQAAAIPELPPDGRVIVLANMRQGAAPKVNKVAVKRTGAKSRAGDAKLDSSGNGNVVDFVDVSQRRFWQLTRVLERAHKPRLPGRPAPLIMFNDRDTAPELVSHPVHRRVFRRKYPVLPLHFAQPRIRLLFTPPRRNVDVDSKSFPWHLLEPNPFARRIRQLTDEEELKYNWLPGKRKKAQADATAADSKSAAAEGADSKSAAAPKSKGKRKSKAAVAAATAASAAVPAASDDAFAAAAGSAAAQPATGQGKHSRKPKASGKRKGGRKQPVAPAAASFLQVVPDPLQPPLPPPAAAAAAVALNVAVPAPAPAAAADAKAAPPVDSRPEAKVASAAPSVDSSAASSSPAQLPPALDVKDVLPHGKTPAKRDVDYAFCDHIDTRGWGSTKAPAWNSIVQAWRELLALAGVNWATWSAWHRETRATRLSALGVPLPGESAAGDLTRPTVEQALAAARAYRSSHAPPAASSTAATAVHSSAAAADSFEAKRPRRQRTTRVKNRGLTDLSQAGHVEFARGQMALIQLADSAVGLPFSLGKIVDDRLTKEGHLQIAIEWYRPAGASTDLYGVWTPQSDKRQADSGRLSSWEDPDVLLVTFDALNGGHLPEAIKEQMRELAAAEQQSPVSSARSVDSSSSSSSAMSCS